MQMLFCTGHMTALLPLFAIGLHVTSGCLLPLIINKLVHAGVRCNIAACAWLPLALAFTAKQCEEKTK